MTVGAYTEDESIDRLYHKALAKVMTGRLVSPRGIDTREIVGHTLVLRDVTHNILISPVRDLNYRFMIAEWLWILFGNEDVATIAQYNSKIAAYSDDGRSFAGAYGPRWINQSKWLYETMVRDRVTRQGVVGIWSSNPGTSKDIPCTLSWQFLERDKKMHMVATMRSSDSWLGLPYDLFNFSQMCNIMAAVMGVAPGSLVLNLGSSHVYSHDWEKVIDFVGSTTDTALSPVFDSVPPYDLKRILMNPEENGVEFSKPWSFYAAALRSKTKIEALQHLRDLEFDDLEFNPEGEEVISMDEKEKLEDKKENLEDKKEKLEDKKEKLEDKKEKLEDKKEEEEEF